MSGLKLYHPDVRFAANKVTPDEMDMYRVYSVRPAINVRWWASAGTAGTAASTAFTILNRLPDVPRNINFILAGSATGMAGSIDVDGKDQFGNTISETIGFGSADNGGTVVGTKVFAQVTSGTLRYGTAVGSGTPQIGFVPGTNCLLGLPDKIKAATDVLHLGHAVGTGAITYGGGTIAAFVDTGMHAIRPAASLDGTAHITVWYKPSFNPEATPVVANLTQAV